MNDLVTAFNEYFEVVAADSPELLQEVFRLRYQVLCVQERVPGFLTSDYPEGLEKDSYDPHSSHILVWHCASGQFVGTVRLILPDPLNPEKPFPIEKHTRLDPAFIDVSKLPRQHTAEISRFIFLSQFQRHKGGEHRDAGITGDVSNPRQRFPHPMLALCVGIMRICSKHNIAHWFSIMDPALNRLLSRYGLHLEPVGPLLELHGMRRPHYADIARVMDRAYVDRREIWELITDNGKVWPAPGERYTDSNAALPMEEPDSRIAMV